MPYKPPIDMGNSIGGKRNSSSGKKPLPKKSGSMMAPSKKKPPVRGRAGTKEDRLRKLARKAEIVRKADKTRSGSGPATRATDGPLKRSGGLAGRTPANSPAKKTGGGKVRPKPRRLDTPDAQATVRRRRQLPPTR
jgi:hypothetical protein